MTQVEGGEGEEHTEEGTHRAAEKKKRKNKQLCKSEWTKIIYKTKKNTVINILLH